MFYLGNLTSQANASSKQIRNVTALSLIGASLSAIGFAGQFIGTIPVVFYGLIDFVSQPLAVLGLPIAYVKSALTLMLIILMVLTLASALLIFPI